MLETVRGDGGNGMRRQRDVAQIRTMTDGPNRRNGEERRSAGCAR
jgi:hypothetical protein